MFIDSLQLLPLFLQAKLSQEGLLDQTNCSAETNTQGGFYSFLSCSASGLRGPTIGDKGNTTTSQHHPPSDQHNAARPPPPPPCCTQICANSYILLGETVDVPDLDAPRQRGCLAQPPAVAHDVTGDAADDVTVTSRIFCGGSSATDADESPTESPTESPSRVTAGPNRSEPQGRRCSSKRLGVNSDAVPLRVRQVMGRTSGDPTHNTLQQVGGQGILLQEDFRCTWG